MRTFSPNIKRQIKKVVVISDAGRDHDDELALTAAAGLMRAGVISIECVIANLKPSLMRARLIKGILDTVDLKTVPVGVGTIVNEKSIPQPYEFDASYLSEQQSFPDGQELLTETFRNAENNSLVLLLISGLTDATLFLKNNLHLAKNKLINVVIMGGVLTVNNDVKRDTDGHIMPDESYNHKVDMEAATSFYKIAQTAKIPLTIVSRHSVMACAITPKFYDDLATFDSPIGKRLCAAQAHSIQHLWRRVFLESNDPKREGLPPYCNKAWFLKTFTNNQDDTKNLTQNDKVWPYVTKINAYDPIAMLAAACPNLFTPFKTRTGATENLIIGLNSDITGIDNPDKIRRLLTQLTAAGLNSQSIELSPSILARH